MTQWGLDNLFNPGKRHMDDEKRRLQATREEIGDASGGRRIDLESGAVSISVGGRRPTPVSDIDDRDDPAEGVEETLPATPEVVDEPEIALEQDEADIQPPVVDETTNDDDHEVLINASATSAPEPDAEPDVPATTEPASRPAARTSAAAWARRG